ncbi:outer plastid envelope protein 16-1 [Wolffia australiana]
MAGGRLSLSASSPRIDFHIDTGNAFLNRAADGFFTIGAVAVAKVAVEETYHCLQKGSLSENALKESLKKMCKEGAYWGTVAGAYAGTEYAIQRIRGKKDWKNSLYGGFITGALVAAASKKNRDDVVKAAITGGAVATAANFINHLA